jgi:two-component system NarL family sensor kinase
MKVNFHLNLALLGRVALVTGKADEGGRRSHCIPRGHCERMDNLHSTEPVERNISARNDSKDKTSGDLSENSATRASLTDVRQTPLAASRHLFEDLLDTLHEFVILLDANGSIRALWSSNCDHIRQIEAGLLGRALKDVLDEKTYFRLSGLLEGAISLGQAGESKYLKAIADKVREISIRVVPIGPAAGSPASICVLARQIGDLSTPTGDSLGPETAHEARSAENLEKIQGLLSQAEELANIGSWEFDVENNTVTWSEHFYRMLGLKPEKGPLPYGRGIQMIHPDDRERAVRDADALSKHGHPFDNELRFVTAAGELRIFHSRAVGITDETARVVFVRGMSRDITERKAAEERLRESEALLAQAEQIANCGSYEFDLATRKPTLSEQLRHIYGLGPDSEWNEQMHWERLHPTDRSRARRIFAGAIAECKPYEYVARYIEPDGGMKVHLTRGIPIPGADGKTARVIGFVQDITKQQQAEEELRRLSQQLMCTRDQDRRHVARELHESAGQSLAALKMTLGRLREALPGKNERARDLLESATELAEGAIREVRTVSYLMHPPLLDEAGLAPALRWYANGFSQRSGIAVSVEVPDDFGRQSQEIETTIFRIVQEALTNVHRYSACRTAQISLRREDGQILAEIRDDGCGLAVPSVDPSRQTAPGVGIAGMRERVQQLNGFFELESAPGRGTTVRAILPECTQLTERLGNRAKATASEGKQRRRAKQARS